MTSRPWAGGSTRSWRRLRRFVLHRDGYRCKVPTPTATDPTAVCDAPANQAGHILARVDGGTDDPRNLRAECASHNLAGGAAIARRRRRTTSEVLPDRWSW